MREFIYYSKTAPTSGKYIGTDLAASGRLDIAVHSVIAAFFLSHRIREDVRMHLIFMGPPDPPKHLEMKPVVEGKTGIDKIYFSKKNVAKVLKKMLYKYKRGEKREVFPGFWVEKKPLLSVIDELISQGKEVFILDRSGEDIRQAALPENPVFLVGDHEGLPSKDLKRLRKIAKKISIGPRTYFASHTIAIVNNELDRRE